MKPTEHLCDAQQIEDYLSESLSNSGQVQFEQHLGVCDRCREELERRAAEPDIWSDAIALLGHRTNESYAESTEAGQHSRALGVLDSLTPTDDPEMLGRIGEYEISGVVGVGGMGAVLKGFDKSLRRVVAIKVMAPHLADSGSARARFQREARAAAAITHDNVIDIYGVSEGNGLPYLVMPYARGPSLQKRIDEGGPLAATEVVRIGRQIAAGLAAAHEQGLVHRDIKPANILLSDGIERLWITDFGVARAIDDASMTKTGIIAGTPQYMSPEQARGEEVDHRSDLFSLGSILYTTCTGRPPFRSEAAYGILRRITDTDPRSIREINPDIPDWLCRVIERLMAKHPADRFQSAVETTEVLEACLAHLQQPTQVALPQSVAMPRLVPGKTPLQSQPSIGDGTVPRSIRFQHIGVWIMVSSLLLAGVGFLAIQLTNPTDISGHWTGEHWTNVSLSSVEEAADWYTGTFTDADGRRGALQLEWARLQRRYNGRWRVGDGESGSITLRVREAQNVRGAVSIDPDSDVPSQTPRLREFSWEFSSSDVIADRVPTPKTKLTKLRPVTILSPTKGVITKLRDGLVENARVKKGEIIVEIKPFNAKAHDRLEQQLAASKQRVSSAKVLVDSSRRNMESEQAIVEALHSQLKTLEQVKEQVLASERAAIRSADYKIEAAHEKAIDSEASVAEMQAEFKRQQTIAKSGLISESELQATKQRLRASEAKLTASRNNLREAENNRKMREHATIAKQQQAQVDIDAARTALKQAEAEAVKSEGEVLKAHAALARVEEEADDLQARLSEVKSVQLVAPCDGIVTRLGSLPGNGVLKEGDVVCVIRPEAGDLTEPARDSATPSSAPKPSSTPSESSY